MKVCIVFDSLRSEEKMLQKEAAGLGCETAMLDAKAARIDTDSKRDDLDLGTWSWRGASATTGACTLLPPSSFWTFRSSTGSMSQAYVETRCS